MGVTKRGRLRKAVKNMCAFLHFTFAKSDAVQGRLRQQLVVIVVVEESVWLPN